MTVLSVTWLGQAGFIYGFPGGATVCVDPYLSHAAGKGKSRERLTPVPLPAWQVRADIVVVTHDHTDHFDEITLRPLAEVPGTVFLGPSSCREHWLAMGLPGERFLRLDQGESLEVAGVGLRALYAEHDSGGRRDAIGVVIEADGFKVYQTGDSEYTERLVETGKGLKPDLLTVPINGRLGNMDHEQAARFTEAVAPRAAIPMHYGMFKDNTADPQDFIDACKGVGVGARVVLMKTGRPFGLEAA